MMTVTLGAWTIPLAITVAVWAWGLLWPNESSGGDYNFGQAVVALVRLAVCVTVTLAVWLVYFGARVAVGV